MREWVFAAALAAAGAAFAQDDQKAPMPMASAPARRLIIKPDWARQPSEGEIARLYSKISVGDAGGQASFECSVAANGGLSDCILLEETPPGKGFGAASLKAAPYFRMKPTDLDGLPVAGGLANIRLRFGAYDTPILAHHPTEDDIQAVWPAKARGVPGSVALECHLVDGRPFLCSVHDETPPHMGFGAAALKLESKFWFTAADPDTLQVGGRTVRVQIKFEPRQAGEASFTDSSSAMMSAPWQVAPTSSEVIAVWPKTAPAGLKEAKVRLRCGFTSEAGLDACTVLTEEPPGQGFTDAALNLAGRFRVRLGAVDPDRLKTARVFVTITFENPAVGRQSPVTLDKPNWVTFIDPQKMTDLYPGKALDAGVKTGRGVVVCTVALGGALTGCTVESEDPPGLDFGPAAVAAMASFTVNPWTEDGHPVDGAKLRVPVRMNEPEAAAASPPDPSQGGAGKPKN